MGQRKGSKCQNIPQVRLGDPTRRTGRTGPCENSTLTSCDDESWIASAVSSVRLYVVHCLDVELPCDSLDDTSEELSGLRSPELSELPKPSSVTGLPAMAAAGF